MNTKLKVTLTTLVLILTVLVGAQLTNAFGNIEPQGTAGSQTHYTLNDIYAKLTAGTATSTKTGLIVTPTGEPAVSFKTLTEIYNAIPNTLTLLASTTTVPVGINRTETTLDAIDTDLTAANIKSGVNVFGVVGTMTAGVSYPTEWSTENPVGNEDWATAVAYCNGLTENSHTDWHLPTYIELVNEYLTNGQGSFRSDHYWSSTEDPSDPNVAYDVSMAGGYSYYDDKTFPEFRARCAR